MVNSPDRVHQTRQGPGQHRAAQTFHPQFEDRQKSVAMGGRDQQQRAIDRLQFPYCRRQLRVYNRHSGDAPPHRISVVTGPRSCLINHLAGRLPGDTGHFDRTVETVKVDGQALTVTDRHGDEHTADVVVGVDGQRPAVRRAISSCRPAKVSCNGGSTSKGGVSSPTRRR
jgi:hypothetical protein